MSKRIFRSICIVSFTVFIIGIALVVGVFYKYLSNTMFEELKSDLDYIAQAVENEGVDYLEGLGDRSRRITVVDENGDVLFDNVANEAEMDDHSQREEIQEAKENGYGTSSRYSDTLSEKILYYAKRLSNGNVLRISTSHYTVISLLIEVIKPVVVVLLFMLILAAIFASRASKRIVEPINALDLENPDKNEVYDEISPLLLKIAKQKKEIDQQLSLAKKKQEEFRVITENMNEGFLVIDKQTAVLSYNSAALTLLGAEKLPENSSVLALNRSDAFCEAVDSALSGKRAERMLTRLDRHYQIIATPVLEESEVIGAVIVILDVTERTQMESMRREFTANVSHELKTPLTSISGFAELMKNGMVKNGDVADFSNSIYEESQRLITLVNDIIKLSELDEDAVPYERESVDLYQLSLEVADRLKEAAAKKHVSISVQGSKAEVYGARQILSEMIYNLCDNGIKYNNENGKVEVTVGEANNQVVLTVRDNGIGIPPEHQSRVFERFYRVDKSHSKEIGGTGLGLSIVKHGAIYHNAKVQLESKPGEGTIVTIIFEKAQ